MRSLDCLRTHTYGCRLTFEPVQKRYNHVVSEPKVEFREVAVRYQLLSQLYIEITSGLYQNVDVLYKFDWE